MSGVCGIEHFVQSTYKPRLLQKGQEYASPNEVFKTLLAYLHKFRLAAS